MPITAWDNGREIVIPILPPDCCPQCGAQWFGVPVILTNATRTYFQVHRSCGNDHTWSAWWRARPRRIRIIRKLLDGTRTDTIEDMRPEHRLPRIPLRRQGNLYSDGMREQ